MNAELVLKIITAIVSVLSLLGVGTLATLFWKDAHEKHKAKTDKALAEEKKRKQEEMREVIKQENAPLLDRLSKVESLLSIDCEGTQAGLRNDLLNTYYNCASKGFKTRYDAENFRDMYVAYTKLGGNSFIQNDVKTWFEELPAKEVYEREHKGE